MVANAFRQLQQVLFSDNQFKFLCTNKCVLWVILQVALVQTSSANSKLYKYFRKKKKKQKPNQQ